MLNKEKAHSFNQNLPVVVSVMCTVTIFIPNPSVELCYWLFYVHAFDSGQIIDYFMKLKIECDELL